MLSNTLEITLRKKLKNKEYPRKLIDKLIIKINYFKTNAYLNPYSISDDLDISEEETFMLLTELVKIGIIKQVYKVLCPDCKHCSRDTFEELIDIKQYLECEKCGHEIIDENLFKYVILLYKVIV